MYLAGPVVGALIAVGFALVLRGHSGDVISRAAGSGVLDEAGAHRQGGIVQGHRPGQGVGCQNSAMAAELVL